MSAGAGRGKAPAQGSPARSPATPAAASPTVSPTSDRSTAPARSTRSTDSAGTTATASPGDRPPWTSGTRTTPTPANPWTRATARAARSANPVCSPQKPSWRPAATDRSSGRNASRARPPVGRPRTGPDNQPSSCHRMRSAIAPAENASSERHSRTCSSPCSVSATIATRAQLTPRVRNVRMNSSANVRATNAAWSTRCTGGSSSIATSRSAGGSLG